MIRIDMRSSCFMFVALVSVLSAHADGWQADPKLQEDLARKKTPWIYREQDVPPYTLPDPLLCADGSRVTTKEQWEQKRRPETLELFRKYVYGRMPPKPSEIKFDLIERDDHAIDGKATRKRMKITSADAGKSFAFEASLLIPHGVPRKPPVFLLINNRAVTSADPTRAAKDGFWPAEDIVARGYATAVFRTVDVDPDKDGPDQRAKGVRGVWPMDNSHGDAWATIAAWAWGASRVLDYLQSDADVDASKVAVIGHSRGGKTALWAAAEDPRFSIACSNDSGCGGAALSKRLFGETVATINKGFPYWFCDNFKKFDNREADLPIDQQQLLALIAPRQVCVGSADADFWADQRGEFLSLVAASPVFALYGFEGFTANQMPPLDTSVVRGRFEYHVRRGIHNLTPYDWASYMDVADRVWGRP